MCAKSDCSCPTTVRQTLNAGRTREDRGAGIGGRFSGRSGLTSAQAELGVGRTQGNGRRVDQDAKASAADRKADRHSMMVANSMTDKMF